MTSRYSIHPSIGVARLGNSPDAFYLEPSTIGGLPSECDSQGNVVLEGGSPKPVRQFKDAQGRIKRQAARFRIFRSDASDATDLGQEVTASDPQIEKIEWTVHLANKKAAWYQFSELEGDRMLGEGTGQKNTNSYAARGVPLRNSSVEGEAERRKLIIDPGPRHLVGPRGRAEFSQETSHFYKFASFPPKPTQGDAIKTLGEMLTDDEGRLVVLGGFGRAGGNEPIDTFAGADTWHDDISDGAVTCRLHLRDGSKVELSAWLIVGSPKFAPELVNIVTLDDIAFDVGVRYQNLVPELYASGKFNEGFQANYKRDIEPLLRRPLDYIWVSNVPSMMGFVAPPFDPRDASEANRRNREALFAYFRRPGANGQQDQLWSGPDQTGIPLMPLNSGSNSVSNTLIDKFLTLTETQYFLLSQWAQGRFDTGEPKPFPGVHPLDRASLGNCVGGPMCPGIEVTWSTRNPPMYEAPYRVRSRFPESHYLEHGLSPTHDETDGDSVHPGCEPGDLTKRMAIPWQADFFQCTVQFVNFTSPQVNKADGIPVPPTYYAYWWPPQSPMFVMSGYTSAQEQQAAGVPAGFQVYYPRGINSFAQMITGWSYLGFIVNQNTGASGSLFPSFVERERNHERFDVATVAVGGQGEFVNAEDTNFWPMWYLKSEAPRSPLDAFAAAAGRARGRVHGRPRGNRRSSRHD